jgi:dihydrofolate reductase
MALPQGPDSVRIKLPSISYVVARSWPDSIIGRNNALPWHLRTDLHRFKTITLDHAIIMGRKTYLSIGRPLPRRVNIILSRTSEFDERNSFWQSGETMRIWSENRESALFFADVISIAKEQSDFFVIGGAEMYRVFGDLFNKIYLTEVLTGDRVHREPDDAVFDYNIDNRKWLTVESHDIPAGPNDDYPSRFTVLERKTKYVRYVEVRDYYTELQSKKLWLAQQLELFDQARLASACKPIKVPYQYHLFEAGDNEPRIQSTQPVLK